MIISACIALAIGLSVQAPPALLLILLLAYAFAAPADSGALTSSMTMSARAPNKGATMALHTTVGFGLSALGAWGAGIMLDLAGGPDNASAWLAVFCLLCGSILLGTCSVVVTSGRRGVAGSGFLSRDFLTHWYDTVFHVPLYTNMKKRDKTNL